MECCKSSRKVCIVYTHITITDFNVPSPPIHTHTHTHTLHTHTHHPHSSSDDAIVHQNSQHNGAIRTLDVNPFQPNLLVSGAGESEIFIWDLNNLTTPMSPGNKIHPLEDITGVAWNRQVLNVYQFVCLYRKTRKRHLTSLIFLRSNYVPNEAVKAI